MSICKLNLNDEQIGLGKVINFKEGRRMSNGLYEPSEIEIKLISDLLKPRPNKVIINDHNIMYGLELNDWCSGAKKDAIITGMLYNKTKI